MNLHLANLTYLSVDVSRLDINCTSVVGRRLFQTPNASNAITVTSFLNLPPNITAATASSASSAFSAQASSLYSSGSMALNYGVTSATVLVKAPVQRSLTSSPVTFDETWFTRTVNMTDSQTVGAQALATTVAVTVGLGVRV